MKGLEVVTFGETMGLFMPAQNKTLETSQSVEKSFGGAESNVAIGLSRLGINVGWMGLLGNDSLGKTILKTLRGENVDVSRAKLLNTAQTGLMLKEKLLDKTFVYYYRRHSAASTMTPDDLDSDYLAKAKILHITGITPALSQSCYETILQAIKLAKNSGVKVSFDPNLRLKLWSIEEARNVILPLLKEVDYFFPGFDELALLYNTSNFDEILNALQDFEGMTVMKGPGDKNYLIDQGVHEIPFYKVDHVVDTVGAGDGFTAGFLAGLLKGFTPIKAVQIGSLVGSLVVQGLGDWESLPEWELVEQILEQKSQIER